VGTPTSADDVASPISLPQPPQNFAVGSFSKPQAGQAEGSGVPHWAQKRRFSEFWAMQLGQRILLARVFWLAHHGTSSVSRSDDGAISSPAL